MTKALDEQIHDLVITKLATITTGNGYKQTVANVYYPPVPLTDIGRAYCPALNVHREDSSDRDMPLRGAIEIQLPYLVQAAVAPAAADFGEEITDLLRDVVKLVRANRFWNDGSANLARRTWFDYSDVREPEVISSVATGSVRFVIIARMDATNPTLAKAV